MRWVGFAAPVAIVAALVLCSPAPAIPPTARSKAASKKASAAKPLAHSRAAEADRPAGPSKIHTQSIASHGRRRRYRSRAAAGPPMQMHPDPERYQQIQKALADRGYFKGEVNGQWNADSVDAMRRFQADQHLDDDGKITALTLTGLGLGPKHDASAAKLSGNTAAAAATTTPAPPPEPQEAPPQPEEERR